MQGAIETASRDDRDAASSVVLARILPRLIHLLTAMSAGEIPAARANPGLEWWGDDDYLYMEASLKCVSNLEADLTISQDRALLRLARQPSHSSSHPNDAPPRIRSEADDSPGTSRLLGDTPQRLHDAL